MADGLKDEYSSTTFDSSLYFQDVEIVKGRDIETKIVYLVKGHSTNLIYNIMDYVVWVRALNKLIIMELKVYHELARELLLTMHISTVSHLQYNGLCGMGPSLKQINHYGTQSLS